MVTIESSDACGFEIFLPMVFGPGLDSTMFWPKHLYESIVDVKIEIDQMRLHVPFNSSRVCKVF